MVFIRCRNGLAQFRPSTDLRTGGTRNQRAALPFDSVFPGTGHRIGAFLQNLILIMAV